MKFREKNVDRIFLMTYLVTAFDYFTQRNLYSNILAQEKTVIDQKSTHDMFNAVFGFEAPFEFEDANDYADKSIEFSDKLERYLAADFMQSFNINKEDVLAFLHFAENDSQLIWLKVNHVKFPSVMNNILSYALDYSSFETFQDNIKYYATAPFPIQCNIKAMTKTLINAETLFHDIAFKRLLRKHKEEELLTNKYLNNGKYRQTKTIC